MKTSIIIALTIFILPFTGWAGEPKECTELVKSFVVLADGNNVSEEGRLLISAAANIGSVACIVAAELAKQSAENAACERLLLLMKVDDQLKSRLIGSALTGIEVGSPEPVEIGWQKLYLSCIGDDKAVQ